MGPLEVRDFGFVLAAALLAYLILVKSDQQIIRILEGMLHRMGKETSEAAKAYRSHTRRLSVIQFVAGMCAISAATMMMVKGYSGYPFVMGLGIIINCMGIIGRLRSFHAAEARLRAADAP